MGSITFNDNNITSDSDGIYIPDWYDLGSSLYGNASFVMDNVEFCGNDINASGYGMNFGYMPNYFGGYLYGNASFIMGTIEFNGNNITSSDDGIYCEEYLGHFGYEMYGNATFEMGSITFNDNNITSDSDGIYIPDWYYLGSSLYGNASFVMDNVEFCGNDINASGYGMNFSYMPNSFGEDLYGNASFVMGSVLFDENHITSSYDGIYCEEEGYLGYFGYEMHGNATFEMGSITFNDNNITSDSDGIYVYEIKYFGYKMYDNSSADIGEFLVNNNTITRNESGIYVNDSHDVASELYNSTNVTVGDITFNNNTIVITSSDNGIYLHLYDFGINVSDTALATLGEFLMDGNTITNAEYGIYFYETDNFTISNNEISDGKDGIYLNASSNTTIEYNTIENNTALATGAHIDAISYSNELHSNCFINNEPQAMDEETSKTNNWTGNLWSDWIGSGPYNISGPANSADESPLDECPVREEELPLPNITDPKVAVDMNGPPLLPGDVICYTAWINNTGNGSSADNPGNEFEDPIPDYTIYVNSSATASSGTVEYNESNNTIIWNGVILANDSIEITFCVTVDSNVSSGTIISNQGTVNYDSDGDGINDFQRPTDNPETAPFGDPTDLTTTTPPQVPAQQVPALTPTGVIALVSVLSLIAAMSIRIRKRR